MLAVALVAPTVAGLLAVTPNAASAGPAGVLVTGRLKTESGTPAANVTVNGLLRLPNHRRSSQAAEINVPVLASTITDANGAFALVASPALVARPFVDEDGAINLTLHVISDSGELLGVSEVSIYRPTKDSMPWQAKPVPPGKWRVGPDQDRCRSRRSKDVQIIVLGHENALLRRQTGDHP